MTPIHQRALGEVVITLQCAMQGESIRALLAACRGEATDGDIRTLLGIPAVCQFLADLESHQI